jgi:quercetin dioxygenase-like cupin family protein
MMALRHAIPGEVVHLHSMAGGAASGKTSALVKSDRFEAVRLVLPAGTSTASHRVEGYFTLFCIEGRAVLEAGGEIELRPGDWVYLDRGAPHAVRAIEDSVLLLHILFDG